MTKRNSVNRDRIPELIRTTSEMPRNNVLLYGPRGTGKTTMAYRSAAPGQEVIEVTLSAEQAAASLIGHFIPEGDHFVWHDGPFLKAWKTGALLVINEIDHASEDVRNILHVIMDDPEVAVFDTANNETVRPAKGFRCIATMNGQPIDLPMAVLDRCGMKFGVWNPGTEQLDRLDPALSAICREEYEASETSPDGEPTLTYRELASFGEMVKLGIDIHEAAYAALDDESDAPRLIERFQTYSATVDVREAWRTSDSESLSM